jgi:AmmeMemoRadiSam system protein A
MWRLAETATVGKTGDIMISIENSNHMVDGSDSIGPDSGSRLSEGAKRALLSLARQRLLEHLEQSEPEAFEVESAALKEHRAAFVTWRTKHGELRGCIGEVIAKRPLVESIERMAVASGTEDPRFPPITTDELPHLTVEISALTPMASIRPENVDVGRHGLMISKGHRSGLLLPQVPLEQGWDRDDYLRGLCAKAGLANDAWRESDVQLRSFEAEVWGEESGR